MQESTTFTARPIISHSLNVFKTHWKDLLKFFGIMLIPAVVFGIFNLITAGLYPDAEMRPTFFLPLVGILTLAMTVVSIYLAVGTIKAFIHFSKNEVPSTSIMKQTTSSEFWRMLGVGIVVGLIVLGGLILLIIPGIIFATRLQFAQYYVVDKGLGVIDAIKASWNATKGYFWPLLGIIAMIFVLSFVASLLAGLITMPFKDTMIGAIVGLIITYAASFFSFGIGGVAIADAYNKLKNRQQDATPTQHIE